MAKRYDVISGRKFESNGQEKTAWTRCGSAWVKDNGSISIKLDVHNHNGEYLLVEPKAREDQGGGDGARSGGGGGGGGYGDIPFARAEDWRS